MSFAQVRRGVRASSRRRSVAAQPSLLASVLGNNGGSAVTSFTYTLPTGVTGKVAVMFVSTAGAQTPTISGGGGAWTLRSGPNAYGTAGQGFCYTRTLTAGDEGATVTLTFGTSQRSVGLVEVYDRVTEAGVIVATPATGTGTTLPTLSGVPAGALIVVADTDRSTSSPPPDITLPGGYSQGGRSATSAGGTETSVEAFWKVAAAAGSYGGETVTITNSQNHALYALALPAA